MNDTCFSLLKQTGLLDRPFYCWLTEDHNLWVAYNTIDILLALPAKQGQVNVTVFNNGLTIPITWQKGRPPEKWAEPDIPDSGQVLLFLQAIDKQADQLVNVLLQAVDEEHWQSEPVLQEQAV